MQLVCHMLTAYVLCKAVFVLINLVLQSPIFITDLESTNGVTAGVFGCITAPLQR